MLGGLYGLLGGMYGFVQFFQCLIFFLIFCGGIMECWGQLSGGEWQYIIL